MKHCPQCNFLYNDSDVLCDLDKTLLISDSLGTDAGMFHEPSAASTTMTAAAHSGKLGLKTLSAATLAALIIGLVLLLGYQKMRPSLQAGQAPPANQAPAPHDFRASRVAQVSQDVSVRSTIGKQEASDETNPSAKGLAANSKPSDTRPDSARLRISQNPVSTGDVSKPACGPVTIRFANGSSLQVDEVWRTKAGVWYRRKGIVTLVKADRVRAVSN
jgi:hypothetical protein